MNTVPIQGGLRQRKRQETLQRIAESGLKLFSDNGYDATTVEAIAEDAGISPRTFFYYFRSKDEVLEHWHEWGGGAFLRALRPMLGPISQFASPRQTAQECLLLLVAQYETRQSLIVDSLMHSTEDLRTRMLRIFIGLEEDLFCALAEKWPQADQRQSLRTIAMITMGAMRLAMDNWRKMDGVQELALCLNDVFKTVDSQLNSSSAQS